MASPETGKSTLGSSDVPRTTSTTSSVGTTGGEWTSKANTMRKAKLDNAQSEPITKGHDIPWAKLDNRERPAPFAH